MALDSGKADRFWNFVVTTFVGMAVGISVNGLYEDYGWSAAAVVAAAAGVTAVLVWLRRQSPRARLVRLIHRTFLAFALIALVTGAFWRSPEARYALIAAVGAVIVVLVTTPGMRIMRTLFRVAVIGLGVGYLSSTLPEWNRSGAMKFAIVVSLLMLANVYIIGWEHGFDAVAEFFATPRPELAIRTLAGSSVLTVLGIVVLFDAGLIAAVMFCSPGLAMAGVGFCMLKGGPRAGAIAITAVGVAAIVIGAAFVTMRGGALVGVALITLGVSLAGSGVTRMEVTSRLHAIRRWMLQDPNATK